MANNTNDIQGNNTIKDEWYPAISEYNPNVSVEQWKIILADKSIFDSDRLRVIARFYDYGKPAYCQDLSDKYGEMPNTYNNPSVLKKISEKYNIKPYKDCGYHEIMFLRNNIGDAGRSKYKLREEIVQALESFDINSTWLYTPYVYNYDYNHFQKGLIESVEKTINLLSLVPCHRHHNTHDFCLINYGEKHIFVKILDKKIDNIQGFPKEFCAYSYKLISHGKRYDSIFSRPQSKLGTWINLTGPRYKSVNRKILNEITGVSFGDLCRLRNERETKNDFSNKKSDNLKSGGENTMKNIILYGPPGTGKTYNTVCYAVAICEGKKIEDVIAEAKNDYTSVKARYDKLKNNGRIEFTTFHQSYGYEEFIEGIRPVMNDSEENKTVEYEISNGIFKAFCDKASEPISSEERLDIGLNNSPTVWKVSLEGTGSNPTRSECMEKGHIRIGYDSYGENITDETDFTVDGGERVLNAFINKMRIGDIVLSCFSSTTIDAIGVITGDYEWHNEYDNYKRLRNVNWIVKGIREDISAANGSNMTLPSAYKLNISVSDVLGIIKKYSHNDSVGTKNEDNYVFIIDEINRGNISKIFGELITLIEPSKRLGQPEELRSILPYSKKPFGVPDNVYIIGTMNTADRSIATIDTALRRRFSFKEMLPDATILSGIEIDEINIENMLESMNNKISVLFDREHTIGHAYFMPLKDSPSIKTLASIFKNNIIPLLQEYFYEDYEKIRLVLGDNKKQDEEIQFIRAINNDYSTLFGTDIDLDVSYRYEINEAAFELPEAYKSI